MFKCIQINLNHCEAAQDILQQTALECQADILIISEPYKSLTYNGKWVEDKYQKAAIWSYSNLPFEAKSISQHEGFAYAKIKGVHFFSCYAPPSASLETFQMMLDNLTKSNGENANNNSR